MKKVSKILYLIGGIMSIVSAVTSFIGGVVILATCGLSVRYLLNAMVESGVWDGNNVQAVEAGVLAFVIKLGVIDIMSIAPSIVLAIFGFRGSKGKVNGGMNIAMAILGLLFSTKIFIPAGVLGFIGDKKKEKVVVEVEE